MPPSIDILVATRRRPSRVLKMVEALDRLGALNRPIVRLLILENGTPKDESVAALVTHSRCLTVSTEADSKAAALNVGLSMTQADLCVFTDDDVVRFSPDWLDRLCSPLNADSSIAYVSGNVIASETESPAARMWEAKGGLSKGPAPRIETLTSLRYGYFAPVAVRLIAAGASCAIRSHVLHEVGGFDERFGPGAPVPHGESLDVLYRILLKGYRAFYDPEAVAYHAHPTSVGELRRKMFVYGLGDTATHMKFAAEYADLASLHESFVGRPTEHLRRLTQRARGRYPLESGCLFAGLCGSVLGPWLYWATRARDRVAAQASRRSAHSSISRTGRGDVDAI